MTAKIGVLTHAALIAYDMATDISFTAEMRHSSFRLHKVFNFFESPLLTSLTTFVALDAVVHTK